jgi:hypothetical protein
VIRIVQYTLVVVVLSLAAWGQDSFGIELGKSRTVSADEYRVFLDRLVTFYEGQPDLNCCDRPDDTPNILIVTDGESTFRLSLDFLPSLSRLEVEKRSPAEIESRQKRGAEERRTIIATLRALRNSVDRPPAVDHAREANAQATASSILAQREFRLVRAPGRTEGWRDTFIRWLGQLFQKIGANAPNIRFASKIILWALIAIALWVVGLLFKRLLESQEEHFAWKLSGTNAPLSSKSWSAWLKDARASAAAGDWRQAVRFAYWAGISSLESAGAWRPDRARTPREYLRLIDANHRHKPLLVSLTSDFERIWYAQHEASEQDFQQTLRRLEEIGCR